MLGTVLLTFYVSHNYELYGRNCKGNWWIDLDDVLLLQRLDFHWCQTKITQYVLVVFTQ